jgi:hypothetical protein
MGDIVRLETAAETKVWLLLEARREAAEALRSATLRGAGRADVDRLEDAWDSADSCWRVALAELRRSKGRS